MDMLSVMLSRIQMGATLTMHMLFPALNIGLALFICIMEGLWLKTNDALYLKIAKFWTKIFALAFGMGVVSGIVMAYELGANFGRFTYAVGEVLGSLFVYEVLSAFFLEAGFLGIMLFGWNKVSPKMHFFATFMVMAGTAFSAFWIMSANSWMQTPAGYGFIEGKYVLVSWMDAIFNPSFIPRFLHMLLATYNTATFFIAGISAWYLLKGRHLDLAKRCFSFAIWSALVVVPLQMFMGDTVGIEVHENQPIKTAAMEGVWETQKGAPFVVFAYPSMKQEKNLFAITIPYMASLINTHSFEGELVGLKSVPPEDRPFVPIVFYTFRIMVGIGVIFLGIAFYGLWLRHKKRLYDTSWFLRLCVLATPLGFVATIAGWYTAEIGRQPWVVYNVMRTAKGASELPPDHVFISLSAFILIYIFILSFYIFYLCRMIDKGPDKLLTKDAAEGHAFQYMTEIDKGA